jgi:hypothetical protein
MGYNKRILKDGGKTEYLINNVIDIGVYPSKNGKKS